MSLSLIEVPLWAGEQHNARGADKTVTTARSKKCWKRQRPLEQPFEVRTGNAPICRAFEKILNTTCESPQKLRCKWTLPPGETRFQKVEWQPLDWTEHWAMIRDWRLKTLPAEWSEDMREKEIARVRSLFEDGRSRLSMAYLDIFSDGRVKQVACWNLLPCRKMGSMFGVVSLETGRIDFNYEARFLNLTYSEGLEIMLYEGKVYLFGIQAGVHDLFVWDTQRANVCRFKYLGEETEE